MLSLLFAASLAVTQAPDTAHVVLVATTDVHGRATAWDYLADRARLRAYAAATRTPEATPVREKPAHAAPAKNASPPPVATASKAPAKVPSGAPVKTASLTATRASSKVYETENA